MANRIQFRRDTLANWQKSNPILMEGELALIATDSSKPGVYDSKKVGDGVHHFNDLEMLGYECLQELGDSTQFPVSQKVVNDAFNESSRILCRNRIDSDGNIIVNNDFTSYYYTANYTNNPNITLRDSGVSNNAYTPYFIVKGLKSIKYNGNMKIASSPIVFCAFFDKDKNVISVLTTSGVVSSNIPSWIHEYNTQITELDIDVPTNAVYCRCGWQTTEGAKITSISDNIEPDVFQKEYLDSKIDENSRDLKEHGEKLNKLEINISENKLQKILCSYRIDRNNNIINDDSDLVDKVYYITLNFTGNLTLQQRNDSGVSNNAYTPYFIVKGLNKIHYIGKMRVYAAPVAFCIFYDLNKKPVHVYFTYSNNEVEYDSSNRTLYNFPTELDIDVPTNAVYCRCGWQTTEGACITILSESNVTNEIQEIGLDDIFDEKIENINSRIDNLDITDFSYLDIFKSNYFTYFFDKCICIGDSMTAGHIYDYPRCTSVIPKYSYPTQLSKLTGWEIENSGYAGITTLGWWQNKASNYNYNDYQLALIELGQNGGLTDTLATDVESHSSYNDYAETNTGSYCKIIEYLKEQNPNIAIVLIISNCFGTGITGQVIRKIANKYNLPVIDLTDTEFMNLRDDKFHGTSNGTTMDYVHYNFIGYLAKAKFIYTYLNKIILDRAKEYNNLTKIQ